VSACLVEHQNLCINDLPDYLTNTTDSIFINKRSVHCLLYADDVILLSSTSQGLQNKLNKILSLTQLYRYTPEIFIFSTATFKYTYRVPLRRIGQDNSANVASSTFHHWNGYKVRKRRGHIFFEWNKCPCFRTPIIYKQTFLLIMVLLQQ
jgi:hypothetical protein